jgi:hypothetical protein
MVSGYAGFAAEADGIVGLSPDSIFPGQKVVLATGSVYENEDLLGRDG